MSIFAHPATRRRIQRAAAGVIGFSLLTLAWDFFPFCEHLEKLSIDFRYSHFNRDKKASPEVVVLDIDEQSMKLLGRHFGKWPWPRRVYKDLIEFLAIGEPAGIFFDLLFSEPTLAIGSSETSKDDLLLADVSAQTGLVSHSMLLLEDSATELDGQKKQNPLPPELADRHSLSISSPPVFNQFYKDALLPMDLLLKRAPLIHTVTVHKDQDGIFRRIPMVFHYDGKWLPSLSIQAILSQLKESKISILNKNWVEVSGKKNDHQITYRIPVDDQGALQLHYYKPKLQPETMSIAAAFLSASQLQKGEVSDPSALKVNPLELKGKIIIIGGSAAGLEDLKATPVDPALPGMLLHAISISNILTSDFLSTLPKAVNIGLTLFSILLIYGSVFLVEALWIKLSTSMIWLGIYSFTAFWLFQKQSYGLELARPLILSVLAFADSLVYLLVIESRDKKKLSTTLSKYLPPAITEKIIATGQDPSAEVGQRKELTVLFSDIRGFTTLSEKTDPEVLVKLLNQYLGKMTDVVFENLGTLDKFIGDAIMAFWGAPVPTEGHAVLAVKCCLQMKKSLKGLNQEWAKLNLPSFQIGVGIHSGEVIVGNIGNDKRLSYTVIGDNVNLASRLEGLTKQYGVSNILGPRTYELAKSQFICRPIDAVQVKGKNQSVKIYEAFCDIHDPEASLYHDIVQSFSAGLLKYQEGDFKSAYNQFESLDKRVQNWKKTTAGDLLCQVMMNRCMELEKDQPKNWNGIFVAKSK